MPRHSPCALSSLTIAVLIQTACFELCVLKTIFPKIVVYPDEISLICVFWYFSLYFAFSLFNFQDTKASEAGFWKTSSSTSYWIFSCRLAPSLENRAFSPFYLSLTSLLVEVRTVLLNLPAFARSGWLSFCLLFLSRKKKYGGLNVDKSTWAIPHSNFPVSHCFPFLLPLR